MDKIKLKKACRDKWFDLRIARQKKSDVYRGKS